MENGELITKLKVSFPIFPKIAKLFYSIYYASDYGYSSFWSSFTITKFFTLESLARPFKFKT